MTPYHKKEEKTLYIVKCFTSQLINHERQLLLERVHSPEEAAVVMTLTKLLISLL